MLIPLGVGAQRGTERQRSWSPEPGGPGGLGRLRAVKYSQQLISHWKSPCLLTLCAVYLPWAGSLKGWEALRRLGAQSLEMMGGRGDRVAVDLEDSGLRLWGPPAPHL